MRVITNENDTAIWMVWNPSNSESSIIMWNNEMTNIVQEYWLNPNNILIKKIRKGIVCNDGFEVSVQASERHYCFPRANLADGNYSEWEVGFPSKEEKELLPFIEIKGNDPTKSVYPCVPTEIILKVIEKHGGIAV